MRHVVRAAEESLDAADPGASWDTFAPWLVDRDTTETARVVVRGVEGLLIGHPGPVGVA